jgi:hypothetical protein
VLPELPRDLFQTPPPVPNESERPQP